MDIENIAKRLVTDYNARQPGANVGREGLRTLSLVDAYRVQQACAHIREADGDGLMGYKVGSKSRRAMEHFGTKSPVLGRLFQCDTWESGAEIPADRFTGFAIEGELAVQLRPDFDSATGVASEAIDSVFVVIELHNRIHEGRYNGSELVANNAIHAGFVWGDTKHDFKPGSGELTIRIDDEIVEEVHGDILTETVIHSLDWLQEELPRHGCSMEGGQTILCGTVAPLIPVPAVCRVHVSTNRFGSAVCATVPS